MIDRATAASLRVSPNVSLSEATSPTQLESQGEVTVSTYSSRPTLWIKSAGIGLARAAEIHLRRYKSTHLWSILFHGGSARNTEGDATTGPSGDKGCPG
jgi:hypothetical protein